MALDTSTLPPKTRTKYLRLGRQFGSQDTLDQANQTLKGLADYGPEVGKHGFVQADKDRLQAARDGLIAAGVGRTGAIVRRR